MSKNKKNKKIVSNALENSRIPVSGSFSKYIPSSNPGSFYDLTPSWFFSSCDSDFWSLSKCASSNLFWDEVLPRLQSFEKQKWSEILVKGKKFNHSIDVTLLNKIAIDRLEDLFVEQESIVSLRLNGNHRLYGYMYDTPVFYVLWYDTDHGDNETCVCRSKLKHT